MKLRVGIGVLLTVVGVMAFLAWWGPKQGAEEPQAGNQPTATAVSGQSSATALASNPTATAGRDVTPTPSSPGPTTMTFEVRVPANTPIEDTVYFFSSDLYWRPMQRVDDVTWAISFTVDDLGDPDDVEGGTYRGAQYDPASGDIRYTYSRGWGNLGADALIDSDGVEYWANSRVTKFDPGTTVHDTVERWRFLPADDESLPTYAATLTEWQPRIDGLEFQAGELLADLWDDQIALLTKSTNEAAKRDSHATWVSIAPPWDFKQMDPLPILSNVDVDVPAYRDEASLRQHIRDIKASGLKLLMSPQVCCTLPQPGNSEEWMRAWFDQYEAFMLYHARIAEEEGVDAMSLDWASGHVSAYPTDGPYPWLESRWREMIGKIREVYHGPIGFNTLAGAAYGEWGPAWSIHNMSSILDQFDFVSVALWAGVGEDGNATQTQISEGVAAALDAAIEGVDMPVVLNSVAYGAFDGAVKGDLGVFDVALEIYYPEQEAHLAWDGIEQAMVFQGVMEYAASHPQIIGVYPFLYQYLAFPKSTDYSVRGKPAEALLGQWYEYVTGQ